MFRSKTRDRKPQKKKQFFLKKIKSCPLSSKGAPKIDYKNVTKEGHEPYGKDKIT